MSSSMANASSAAGSNFSSTLPLLPLPPPAPLCSPPCSPSTLLLTVCTLLLLRPLTSAQPSPPRARKGAAQEATRVGGVKLSRPGDGELVSTHPTYPHSCCVCGLRAVLLVLSLPLLLLLVLQPAPLLLLPLLQLLWPTKACSAA